MNCPECQPLLDAYVDGELDLTNVLALEQHLKTCAPCHGAVRQLESVHLALQHPDLSFEAPRSLRKKITTAAGASPKHSHRRWTWNFPSFAFGGLCALAAVLIFAPAMLSSTHSSDPLVDSHLRSLMADHLTDVASTDSHTVKPWFNGQIDFSVPVKDFAAEGFPLIGGRIDYLQQRRVAALVYKRNRHTVNVFIWPTDSARDTPTHTKTQRGFSIVERDWHGLHFNAVSDLNREELTQLLTLITTDSSS